MNTGLRRDVYAQIGLRIAEARTERGLSQSDLARMLDTTSATVSRWESGAQRIRLEMLCDLADVLRVPVDYFLAARAGEMKLMIDMIIRELDGLDTERMNLALAMARTLRSANPAGSSRDQEPAVNNSPSNGVIARVRKHHSDQEDPIAGLISSQNFPSDKTITRQIDYSGIKIRLKKPLAGRILTQPRVAYATATV